MPDSDEALMSSAGRGDREAFTALFKRYRVPVMTFICHYVYSFERAEDLFQETFVRLWRSRRRYDGSRPFRPWLYSIAANICRDEARRMRYRKTLSLDAELEGVKPSDRIPSKLPSPSESAEKDERAGDLRTAIGSLPRDNRVAIVLHQFQGLKYREIAEVLDVPIGTVKSRIHSAMAQLRKILK